MIGTRAVCPACSRMSLMSRVRTADYRCRKCGWSGKTPRRISHGYVIDRSPEISQERADKILKIKSENPEMRARMVAMICFESEITVLRVLKDHEMRVELR